MFPCTPARYPLYIIIWRILQENVCVRPSLPRAPLTAQRHHAVSSHHSPVRTRVLLVCQVPYGRRQRLSWTTVAQADPCACSAFVCTYFCTVAAETRRAPNAVENELPALKLLSNTDVRTHKQQVCSHVAVMLLPNQTPAEMTLRFLYHSNEVSVALTSELRDTHRPQIPV
jgi:hypothetical protein